MYSRTQVKSACASSGVNSGVTAMARVNIRGPALQREDGASDDSRRYWCLWPWILMITAWVSMVEVFPPSSDWIARSVTFNT